MKRRSFLSLLLLPFIPKKERKLWKFKNGSKFVFISKRQQEFFEEKEDLVLYGGNFSNSMSLGGLPYYYDSLHTNNSFLGIKRDDTYKRRDRTQN